MTRILKSADRESDHSKGSRIHPSPEARPLEEGQQENRDGHCETGGSQVIECVLPPFPFLLEERPQEVNRGYSEGDVDVKHPPPVEEIGDQTSGSRPHQARCGPYGREDPLHLPSLLQGVDVSHQGNGHGHDPAGSQPLDGSVEDELVEGMGCPAEDGANEEEGDGYREDESSAEEVRQLPVHGDGSRGCQEVGAEDPAVAGHAPQVRYHGGHGRAHGRGLKCSQEHRQDQPGRYESSIPSWFHGLLEKGRAPAGPTGGSCPIPVWPRKAPEDLAQERRRGKKAGRFAAGRIRPYSSQGRHPVTRGRSTWSLKTARKGKPSDSGSPS